MASQDMSGIWIQRINPFQYNTLFRPMSIREGEIGFIPFPHNHEEVYLGSIGFLDMSTGKYQITALPNMSRGLLLNNFFPIGSHRPNLLGKGLARRIEFEVAKDLLIQFPEDTPMAVGATSPTHLDYCRKVGLTPFQPMPLSQYHDILQRSIR